MPAGGVDAQDHSVSRRLKSQLAKPLANANKCVLCRAFDALHPDCLCNSTNGHLEDDQHSQGSMLRF